ncbi:MAG: hypothetical protein NTZ37_08130 [Methanoregula sp.]|nr:hypothetical protein [Methanoregula sp.]
MSGKKDQNDQWRQTSVVIRADIFSKAGELGLDISHECNRALANLVGIDYPQQQISGPAISGPVILDADNQIKGPDSTSQKTQAPVIHPVINADDPTAITKVLKAKRQPPVKSVSEIPVLKDSAPSETAIAQKFPAQGVTSRVKGKTVAPDKKRKDDGLKKFVATKITRVDADDAVITKDDMYQAFTRWCRDHRIAAVPERKVFATSLKNKFAITEKTVNGTPCWMNVQLK